jgi:membrane protein DedA with SNARE-associated domain
MIESFIAWLAGLPPVAIYIVIGLLAAAENIFPPLPADMVIALGAFLAYRGITDAWLVFAVTLGANMFTAMGMYYFASRHSAAFFRSKLARHLLPDNAMAFVRKEYDRFGLVGLFVGRFLPGFRAVVAPFAGLVHVGPIKAGIVMTLASGLWYGGIIYLASQLGARWGEIMKSVARINQGAGIIALLVLVTVGLIVWRRRRRRRMGIE